MASTQEIRTWTVRFVNIAHAFDHFVLLIFPTAVIAIAQSLHRDYSSLISLSTGAFVAFGLFALPVGWLADRFGRRMLLGWFFLGYGASCILVGVSGSVSMLAVSLLVLGIFSAIYHPIGSAMIVDNNPQLGRALGINGVWGNMGAALAPGITGALAAAFGWRAAFFVPGVLLLLAGAVYWRYVQGQDAGVKRRSAHHGFFGSRGELITLLFVFMTAILAGGLVFNVVTIAMPKIIDERLGIPLPLAATGWITTGIFVCGALTQITVGRLMDRVDLITLFVWLSALQPAGLLLAGASQGLPMAIGLIVVTSAIYGQVVVNDAMVGRYVPDEHRNRVYSVRFFLSFTVAGFAVPLIGIIHESGGFSRVLFISGAIAAVILVCAIATWVLTRGKLTAGALPAE